MWSWSRRPAARARGAAVAGLTLWAVGCGSGGPEPPDGWTRGPALPEPVQELHAAVLGGRIYVAGGSRRGNAVSAAVYRLDPAAGSWQRVADLPAPRHHMPLAAVGDSLYAIGGLGPTGFDAVGTLWLYHEAAGRWVERAPLPEPRGASAAAVGDGRIIVVGGFGVDRRLLDSIAVYDPRTGRWRHGAPIPTPRDHLAAAAVNDRIYVIGGGPKAGLAQTDVVEVFAP